MRRIDPWFAIGLFAFFALLFVALFGERIAPSEPVASLPIVEYIFQWNGIGYIALQSIANHDPAAFTASALVLVTLFALLSFIADVGRPRFAYR